MPSLAPGGRRGIAARHERWSVGLEAWTTLPTARLDSRGVWRPGPLVASLDFGASLRFFDGSVVPTTSLE